RRHSLLGFQLGRQFRHRDVRIGFDPLQQSRQIGRQFTATWRTPLSRRLRRPRLGYPIRQLHRKACTDIVPPSRRPPRLPACDLSPNTLPKVNRIRLPHPCWPPCPVSILNQISDSLGIPFRFRLIARRSRCSFVSNPMGTSAAGRPCVPAVHRPSSRRKASTRGPSDSN